MLSKSKIVCLYNLLYILTMVSASKLPKEENPTQIYLLGLNDAGKTAIFNSLLGRNFTLSQPTVGFNLEEVRYKDLSFFLWDLGGQCRLRSLWKHFLTGNTNGIIFVVDAAAGKERLKLASKELHETLRKAIIPEELFLLVLANKQDMDDKLSAAEIVDGLKLVGLKYEWELLETSAKHNTGIIESLECLHREFN
ncbi:ADP-ribosylation factor 1-like [Bactrocera tryoni]|uniref:ADP-ribosylation factor 1-like n=1 Tax=Bactrocera tryoni TaxID=59916 RepID=UPI001A99A9E6|nr:ADP-ribosylation factor 1-like [Bactrocera tryoni]